MTSEQVRLSGVFSEFTLPLVGRVRVTPTNYLGAAITGQAGTTLPHHYPQSTFCPDTRSKTTHNGKKAKALPHVPTPYSELGDNEG